MNLLTTCILAIVEGITEFLPISSTGHMILAARLLSIPQSEFVKSFELFIQLGAIMAVVSLYAKNILSKPKRLIPIMVAFLPTGILGVTVYKLVKGYLLSNVTVVLASLFFVGILLIVFEKWWGKHGSKSQTAVTLDTLSLSHAVIIGLFQSIAMIPGVSRSAATTIGGMITGLSRSDALEFSFLLAIPTMLAATGYDLLKSSTQFSLSEWQLLGIGFLVSWVSALFAVKALVSFVRTHSFIAFGVYRIALSAVLFFVFSKTA